MSLWNCSHQLLSQHVEYLSLLLPNTETASRHRIELGTAMHDIRICFFLKLICWFLLCYWNILHLVLCWIQCGQFFIIISWVSDFKISSETRAVARRVLAPDKCVRTGTKAWTQHSVSMPQCQCIMACTQTTGSLLVRSGISTVKYTAWTFYTL